MNGNISVPVTIYFLTLFLFNYITLNRNVVFTVRLMPKGVLRFFFYIYDVIKIFFTIRITSDNRSFPKSIFPNNSPFIITYRNRKMYSRLNQFWKCLCRICFRFSNSSFRFYTVSTICILIWKISSYILISKKPSTESFSFEYFGIKKSFLTDFIFPGQGASI